VRRGKGRNALFVAFGRGGRASCGADGPEATRGLLGGFLVVGRGEGQIGQEKRKLNSKLEDSVNAK